MTSSTDVMVASHKTANHKNTNRHVTISDSNTAVTSTQGTHSHGGSQDHNLAATSSHLSTNNNSGDNCTSPQEAVTRLNVSRLSPDSSRVRHSREEYYDILHPEPKDQTLESRDNPFLPGGELSREAEDLLSRATIIRDHFYLNEDEKRTLREHQQKQQQEQQEKQQRNAKHVHIMEHTNEEVASSDIEERHQPSPPSEAVEERISPQENSLAAAAPAPSHNGGDNHQLKTRENGKAKPATAPSENLKLVIPDGENQSRPAGPGDVQVQFSGPGELQVHEADKKRRNKCCSIM